MATQVIPVPVYYNGGSSKRVQRSARDICENDYNYTEDPALSECMASVVAERQHTDQVANNAMIGLFSFIGLFVIGIIIWMIWVYRY